MRAQTNSILFGEPFELGEPFKLNRAPFALVSLDLPRFVVQVLGNFSVCLSLSRELARRQVAERGVGYVVVVAAPPFLQPIDGAGRREEKAVLRHQVLVLRRKLKGRACLANNHRWFFVKLYCWFPSILPVLVIIRPETLVGWHRAGFRCYWR